MTQLTELDESVETESSRGLSRRTLVKTGLVAGGALWATPVVQVLGTRIAAAASGSTKTPSYVMLILTDGTSNFAIKVDNSGALSCTTTPNNGGGGGAAAQNTAFTNYAGAFNLNQSVCATSDVASVDVSSGMTITLASKISLVGFMIHDGSLPGTSPQVAFPGDASLSGWTISTSGSTLVFNKP